MSLLTVILVRQHVIELFHHLRQRRVNVFFIPVLRKFQCLAKSWPLSVKWRLGSNNENTFKAVENLANLDLVLRHVIESMDV